MKIPESANLRDAKGKLNFPTIPNGHPNINKGDNVKLGIPGNDAECIQNIFFEKQFITRDQALSLIQHLSGSLAIDARIRQSQKKYNADLR